MKHTVQWYVWKELAGGLGEILQHVETAGFSLTHRGTGPVKLVSAETGREGELVETTREALASAELPVAVQLWVEDGWTDVICHVSDVPSWHSILLEFDFDGLVTGEARRAVAALFEAQQAAGDATAAWLSDRVGVCLEHGAPHTWDGGQTPAWPPDRRPGVVGF